MPWPTARSFRKHNRNAVGKVGTTAAHMATRILQRTGDEGEAIATANKYIARHRGSPRPRGGRGLINKK